MRNGNRDAGGVHIRETPITIGDRIRNLRREHHWSQAQLASIAQMSPNHVAYLELSYGEPGMETLRRLAGAFGLTLAELMEGVT